MNAPYDPRERRAEEYADGPAPAADREPVYFDGTPRYECWNGGSLSRQPGTARKADARKSAAAPSSNDPEQEW